MNSKVVKIFSDLVQIAAIVAFVIFTYLLVNSLAKSLNGRGEVIDTCYGKIMAISLYSFGLLSLMNLFIHSLLIYKKVNVFSRMVIVKVIVSVSLFALAVFIYVFLRFIST